MKTWTLPQLAGLLTSVNPDWLLQGSYAGSSSFVSTGAPLGGRRWAVLFPTAPTSGDPIQVVVNEVAISVNYDGAYATLATAIRQQPGVQACYTTTIGGSAGVEVVFLEGHKAIVDMGDAHPVNAAVVETSEGISVSSVARMNLFTSFQTTPAFVEIQDLRFDASPAFRRAAGASITVNYNTTSPSQALSVSVSGLAITVELATDGASAATSTGQNIIDALHASAAAMKLISVGVKSGGNAATVQTGFGAAQSLASPSTAQYSLTLWAMMDGEDSSDDSFNRWVPYASEQISNLPLSASIAISGLPVDSADRVYMQISNVGAGGTLDMWFGLCRGV